MSSDSDRVCKGCESVLIQHPNEAPYRFRYRLYCSHSCFNGSKPTVTGRPLEDTVDEYEFLSSCGYTLKQVAEKLDIKYTTLQTALKRWERRKTA
jgi:hypothetical protein